MDNTPTELAPAAAHGKLQRQWIEATITRADGTVEHLGIISDTRLSWQLKQAGKRLLAAFSCIFGKDR